MNRETRMNDGLGLLLADVRAAVGTVEALDADSLPPLVVARLLLAVEDTRAGLRRAVDAAVASRPKLPDPGPLYQ
jgi:hypothetical protein